MKVLVSDDIAEQGVEILKRTKGIDVDVNTKLSPDELKNTIKNYQGLIVRSATKVTADVVNAGNNLRVVGRAGSGVDNIDVVAASKKGIVVMNTPGGNTITTAEHAISMMLSLAREIPQATASTRSGKWEKKRFMGSEVFNKTLGIMGIGNIGSVVADRAQGLKMKVIAYDPFISEEKAKKLGIELVTLNDLYSRSDFISVHVPLTSDTKGLVNGDAFKKMKKGVFIINCARGGIVNEKALYEAIKSGIVAGAALDVFEQEPPKDSPLLSLEEVICTPHLGASTEEAQINVAIAVSEQIVDYLMHGIIRNAVNFPSITPEALSILQPYLTLAERIGSFQSQFSPASLEEVHIEYSGDVADYDVVPLTIAALKGLLTPIMEEGVNFVNAPIIARERGIKVIESKSSKPQEFASLITLKTIGKGVEKVIAGAIFGKNDPRIVRIDNFLLDAIPEGYILVLENWDKPGVIGNIGTMLGKNNINIARLELGRDKPGGKAISLLNIDQPVTKQVLGDILTIPNIISATQVHL